MTSPYLDRPLRSEAEAKQDMARHTPGPWEISHAGKLVNGNETSGLFIDARDGTMICDLYVDAGTALHQFDNAEANAHLIAAAPDLLEALDDIAKGACGDNVSLDQTRETFGSAMWDWSQKRARAAIAKAKDSQ